MVKCLDFLVKIVGNTCQHLNYKVPLHCLEKTLSFLQSYWYKTLVPHGRNETFVIYDFGYTWLHQFGFWLRHGAWRVNKHWGAKPLIDFNAFRHYIQFIDMEVKKIILTRMSDTQLNSWISWNSSLLDIVFSDSPILTIWFMLSTESTPTNCLERCRIL